MQAARAYEIARDALSRAITLLQALFAGVWLGLLRDADLDAIDEQYHLRSAFKHRDHNLQGLFFWERECLSHFPETGRILVTAAGGGREVIGLVSRGYDVDGCECNPELVAAANALFGHRATVTICERSGFDAPRPPYDAVVIGWGSYAMVRGQRHRIRFLRAISAIAKPNAPILLSFPIRTGRPRALRLTQVVANLVRRVLFRRGDSIELGDNLRRHFIHHFDRAALDAEIRAAGCHLELFGDQGYGHAVCRVPKTESSGDPDTNRT